MAAGNNNRITENDDVEMGLDLEVMRKDDFSWHPCKVSLRSGGVGLIVEYEYGNDDSDDIIVTKEDALSRLRIRSTPVLGDECSLLQEGDCVLATRKSPPKGLFFEAHVEKPLRVRHSKRIHCRCTFVVRWIHHGHEGETSTVPCSAIMKMSTKCITLHPTIVAFFNSLTTPSHCNISPLPAVLESMDYEMDVFELEKQIEEISNAADASIVKISEKIIEDDFKGQAQSKAIPKLNVSDSGIQLPPFITHMKEIEVKSSSPSQEELVICRTPPNPIAACASLASLMSKFSQSTDYAPTLDEAKVFRPQPGVTYKHVTLQCSVSVNNAYFVDDSLCFETEGTPATFVPKYENIVKTLFPTKEATREPKIFDVSFEASKWESKNEECHPQIVDSVANTACSTAKENLDMPARSTLSCSTKQRSSEVSRKNVEMTCVAGQKLMPTINRRRLTRSAVREAEEEVIAEAKNVNKKKLSSAQERDLLEDEKTVVSPTDAETASTFSHNLKDQVANREIYKNNDSKKKNRAAGLQILNNSRRLTSSAVRAKTENNNVEPHKKFEERRLSDYVISDISNGDITSESDASETETPNSATLPNGISSTHTVEKHKKVQKASLMKTTQKIEGDAASNHRCSQGVKRKSIALKKQELRFSPRLRFLPRTRSQNQS